jgi:hemerythrin-like domain-containing protein
MQEHNWVTNFLNNRLIKLEEFSSSDQEEYQQAKNDLNEFVTNLRTHFKEEEQILFPLTLRVESLD